MQHDKCRKQRDRDGDGNQQRTAPIAQEPPEDTHRQQHSQQQITGYQFDCTLDEHRSVERLLDIKAEFLQRTITDFIHHSLDFGQRGQHIGAVLTVDSHTHGGIAVLDDYVTLWPSTHLDFRDIAKADRTAIPPLQYLVAQLIRIVASFETQGILPAPHIDKATGNVITAAGSGGDVGQRQAKFCRAVGVDDNLQLLGSTRQNFYTRDSVDGFDPWFDDVLDLLGVISQIPGCVW